MEALIAAIIYLVAPLEPRSCERVTIEIGQVACFNRSLPAGVELIHTPLVERIELARTEHP